jgi:hypothetical protein
MVCRRKPGEALLRWYPTSPKDTIATPGAHTSTMSTSRWARSQSWTLLEIATPLGYVRDDECEPLRDRMDRAGQMLRRLQQRLEFGGRMRPTLLGALACITLLLSS